VSEPMAMYRRRNGAESVVGQETGRDVVEICRSLQWDAATEPRVEGLGK